MSSVGVQVRGGLLFLALLLAAGPAGAQAPAPAAPDPARLALKLAVGRLFVQTYEVEAEYALSRRLSLTLAPRLLAGPIPVYVSTLANEANDEVHGVAVGIGGRYYVHFVAADGNGLAGFFLGLKAEYQRLRPLYRLERWGEDPGPDGLLYYAYRFRDFTETIERYGAVATVGYQAQLVHPRLRLEVSASANALRSRSSAGAATRYDSGPNDYAHSGLSPTLGLSVGFVIK